MPNVTENPGFLQDERIVPVCLKHTQIRISKKWVSPSSKFMKLPGNYEVFGAGLVSSAENRPF